MIKQSRMTYVYKTQNLNTSILQPDFLQSKSHVEVFCTVRFNTCTEEVKTLYNTAFP